MFYFPKNALCEKFGTKIQIGSFRVKSTNASSMAISDFLDFAVSERCIMQEQNKINLNLISPFLA